MTTPFAQELTESGLVPDSLTRHGIRHLLRQRLAEIGADDIERLAVMQTKLVGQLRTAPIAELTDKANEQHYEVPAEFYRHVLGRRLKYSCAYWTEGLNSLDDAERDALRITCKRARLTNGLRILELGCGWGSLTLWMAEHYPDSRITAVSNSRSQADFIRNEARLAGLANVEVITADMNDFSTDDRFDRVVSVEMFEHMRNWPELFRRISTWLQPEGVFFMHIFTHRNAPYLFEQRDASDWMSRHFFSGGMMPSADLPLYFQDHLRLEQRWTWSGVHYQKTANAWLANMDGNRNILQPVIQATYGADFARIWWMRWRMFFMACSELFGFNKGQEWFVSHYRFSTRREAV